MLYKSTVNFTTVDKNNEPITLTTLFYVVKDTLELVQEYMDNIITNNQDTIDVPYNGEIYTVNKNIGVIVSIEEQTNK
jgi:hypothetical protein